MLTSYIYGPTFGNAETVSFYLLHNVSTLNQCRAFLALLGAPYIYIYDISSLRVKLFFLSTNIYFVFSWFICSPNFWQCFPFLQKVFLFLFCFSQLKQCHLHMLIYSLVPYQSLYH